MRIIVKYFDPEGETRAMAEENNLLKRKIELVKSNFNTIRNKFDSILNSS